MRRVSTKTQALRSGFTLMEILIALMILALALGAITYSNSTALFHVARTTRMTAAAFLMEGVVNDIHGYYVAHGFPSNSVYDRECEMPEAFQDTFECRYDLEALELKPEVVQALVQGGVEAFLEGAGLGGESASPSGSQVPDRLLQGDETNVARSSDLSKLLVLAPLFGPDGEAFIRLCNVNLGGIMLGMNMLIQHMPMVVEQVARRTRKLTVRLAWREGPDRQLSVQTFVVSLPEEEMRALREAERMREVQEAAGQGAVPTSAPSRGSTSGGAGTESRRGGR